MTIRTALTVLCLLALAGPAAAEAAAPKSAQRFADAALRYRQAVRATAPEIDRRLEAIETDRCGRAMKRVPERLIPEAFLFASAGVNGPVADATLPAEAQFLRDLDAIPTNDPILRAGRAGQRAAVASTAAWPRIDQPCVALERWVDARFDPNALPPFDEKAFASLVRRTMRSGEKMDRAAKRLRQLGVPAGAAARFSTDQIQDPVLEAVIEKHFAFFLDLVEAGD